MFLLDNGARGCNASAAVLGRYTGLSERSVEKYRAQLAELGLVYRVTGTRGWHVNLPAGPPADHAKDAEILAYMRRIMVAIMPAESTPSVVLDTEPESTPTGDQVRQLGRESTPSVVAKYAQHRTDTEPESTPSGVESVANSVPTAPAGLMSTLETHDKGTHELRQQQTHEHDASLLETTHENGNGNGVSRNADSQASVREIVHLLGDRMTAPRQEESIEERRARFKAMTRQK